MNFLFFTTSILNRHFGESSIAGRDRLLLTAGLMVGDAKVCTHQLIRRSTSKGRTRGKHGNKMKPRPDLVMMKRLRQLKSHVNSGALKTHVYKEHNARLYHLQEDPTPQRSAGERIQKGLF